MATSPPGNLTPEQLATIMSQKQGAGAFIGGSSTGPGSGRQWWSTLPAEDPNSFTLNYMPGYQDAGLPESGLWMSDPSADQSFITRLRPDTGGNLGDRWDDKGVYQGTVELQNGGGRGLNQAIMMAAPAVGGIIGAAGTAAGGGSTMANGAFLGENMASGIGAWDAAAVKSAIGSGSLGTAAGYLSQNAANGTLGDTLGNMLTPPGQNPVNSPNTPPTGQPSGTPSNSPTSPPSGTKTFGDKVMDTLTSPSTIRAGIGAIGAIAGANKSGDNMADLKSSNTDPATLIPLLQSIYGDNWRDQLNASRYNIVNDSGTSTWSQSPTFNESGYNAAMKTYNDGVAAGNKSLPMPTREQYTTSTWTNTSKLNPDAQKLKDTSSANNQWIADSLTPQMQKYATTVNSGPNRSGIPNYQYTANTKDQQQQNPNSLPTYQNITDTGKFQTPQYGQLNQGPLQNSVQQTSRDWAGALAPQIENYSSRLSGRDPFSYYQQGADAAYGQATRYLLPKQQQDMQALESRLGEQGFVPGTPAYAQALRQQLDSNAVALADARDRAITAGQKGGYDAYTGETSALTGAMTGLNNLGTLGVNNDTSAFKQNLDAGNFFNDAQGQAFDQSKIASDRVRQTGLDANAVAQQIFNNTTTMADTNNKNATNTFTNLRDLTADNNRVIGANNKTAFDLADLNNKTVTDARTMANNDYTTDTNAQQKLVADALSQVNKGVTGTTAPGAGISNVGAAQTADIPALLQQFFGNNANIANANTASNNAQTQALGQLLAAIIPGLFGK